MKARYKKRKRPIIRSGLQIPPELVLDQTSEGKPPIKNMPDEERNIFARYSKTIGAITAIVFGLSTLYLAFIANRTAEAANRLLKIQTDSAIKSQQPIFNLFFDKPASYSQNIDKGYIHKYNDPPSYVKLVNDGQPALAVTAMPMSYLSIEFYLSERHQVMINLGDYFSIIEPTGNVKGEIATYKTNYKKRDIENLSKKIISSIESEVGKFKPISKKLGISYSYRTCMNIDYFDIFDYENYIDRCNFNAFAGFAPIDRYEESNYKNIYYLESQLEFGKPINFDDSDIPKRIASEVVRVIMYRATHQREPSVVKLND